MKKRALPALWLLTVLLTIRLYTPTLGFEFAYDDYHRILYNDQITEENFSWTNITEILLTPTFPGDLYRPITDLSFRLNYLFGMGNPVDFHFSNIILHVLVVLLIGLIATPLFKSPWVPWFGATIYAVHPINVESVASISGRAELLAALFGMAAVWLTYWGTAAMKRIGQPVLVTLAGLAFIAAILSKESALTLLVVAPLYVFIRYQICGCAFNATAKRKLTLIFSLLSLISVSYLVVRLSLLNEKFLVSAREPTGVYHPENALLHYGFTERLVPALKYFGDYIQLLLLPINLSIDYSLSLKDFWLDVYAPSGLLAMALGVATLGVIYSLRKELRTFWALWFLFTFSLTLNVIVPIGTVMGERLAYLPAIGFVLFVCSLVSALAVRWKIGLGIPAVIGVTVIALFFYRSSLRLPIWKNNRTLYESGVVDAPLSPKSTMQLGMHWLYQGHNLWKAERYFRATHAIDPSITQAGRYLIDIFVKRKDFSRAEFWCHRVLKQVPGDKLVLDILAKLNDLKAAARKLETIEPQVES